MINQAKLHNILDSLKDGDVFGVEPRSYHRVLLHYDHIEALKELIANKLTELNEVKE